MTEADAASDFAQAFGCKLVMSQEVLPPALLVSNLVLVPCSLMMDRLDLNCRLEGVWAMCVAELGPTPVRINEIDHSGTGEKGI